MVKSDNLVENNPDWWNGARRCTAHSNSHHRCWLPIHHNGMHHNTHFLWHDDGDLIRHDDVRLAARREAAEEARKRRDEADTSGGGLMCR